MTSDDGLTPVQRAFLASREHAGVFSDMDAAQIERLDMATFARMTGREFGFVPVRDSMSSPEAVQANAAVPPQQPAEKPQGLDPHSAEYFHAWRANRARGGEGVGIFDSVDSQSQAYASAARAQASRHALSNINVTPAPRLEGRYVRQDDMRDTRPAARRFGTPGNSNQF